MAMLREWRRQEAADQQLPAYCVFTDATLIAIAEARPHSIAELIKVQGLGPDEGRQVRRAPTGDHGSRGRPYESIFVTSER